jgi:hypothetical protein
MCITRGSFDLRKHVFRILQKILLRPSPCNCPVHHPSTPPHLILRIIHRTSIRADTSRRHLPYHELDTCLGELPKVGYLIGGQVWVEKEKG